MIARFTVALLCGVVATPCAAQLSTVLVCAGEVSFDSSGLYGIGSSIGPEAVTIDFVKGVAKGLLGYSYGVKIKTPSEIVLYRKIDFGVEKGFSMMVKLDRYTGLGNIYKFGVNEKDITWAADLQCELATQKF